MSGLFVYYLFSEVRWWTPGPWDLSGFLCITYLVRSDGGHLVPGTCRVFLCVTYLAGSGGGHLVPGTCQVFLCVTYLAGSGGGHLVPETCQVFCVLRI